MAQAQSSPSSNTTTGSGAIGILIAYWICNSRKRQAIGGWLLYYYLQLFCGALFSFVILFGSLRNFNAQLWNDSSLYTLYLLSTIPTYITLLAELTVAGFLLSTRFRKPKIVDTLRIVFVLSFVFSVVALIIDASHWPDNVAINFLPMFVSALWFFYFTRSKRVHLVLRQNDWNPGVFYPFEAATEPSTVTKQWLRNYLIVIGVVIVIVLLLVILTQHK